MKKVITYGTFDLFHQGHLNILKRAKKMGDYLIVGVTSENYDYSRGKLNVSQTLMERIENVKSTGLADKIIVEEYFGQKIRDIKEYNVDTFVIGSDWLNKFDYLKPFCNVVYLERTKGISSTQLRNTKNRIINIGIVGNGRIAKRFVEESKYVSGLEINYVFGRNICALEEFCQEYSLQNYFTEYEKFLENVDAVYIALPHTLHYEYAKMALLKGKHVLCEKPITLKESETKELFDIANDNNLVLLEAIKTAFAPCFDKLISVALSGIIGEIKDIDATFTKLIKDTSLREYNPELGGGSINELASYPLLLITKIFGTKPEKIQFVTKMSTDKTIDLMNKIILYYPQGIATANTGIGIKREGDCVISGTEGYIYIPAPWWKTEYFEIKFENQNENQKVSDKFDGDGLRYEIAEFIKLINTKRQSFKLLPEESIFITSVIEKYNNKVDKNIWILN